MVDPNCGAHGIQYFEPLIVGKANTVFEAVVYVSSKVEDVDSTIPTDVATLNQKGCQYIPSVVLLRTGQTLKVLNSDKTIHNVHGYPTENNPFNHFMTTFIKELTKVFSKPEFPILVKCDVHPWMKSYIGVFSHPYFTKTDKTGKFSLDLPPGSHTITVWHSYLGKKEIKIKVSAKGAQLMVVFPPKK